MSRLNRATSSRSAQVAAAPTAWRIRFVKDDGNDGRVIQKFADPLPMTAIAEGIAIADLPQKASWPESVDELFVVYLPNRNSSALLGNDWLGAPQSADAPLAVSFSLNDSLVRWRPGRAVIEGEIASPDEALAAISEFAFYEAQLRKLEQEIVPIEKAADDDVKRAFVIRSEDTEHWMRFRATIEHLAALRLTAARLEPRLYLRPRALALVGRQIVSRLRARADIESRLEAFSDRLEACEDLYEGAVDRITDHRWYRKGMWVEIAIVILLFLEVLQIAVSMMFHGLPGH